MNALRRWLDLCEGAMQSWFVQGRNLTPAELNELDVSEYLEGDEFDYEWRLCRVPIALFADANARELNFADSAERLADIRQFFAGDIDAALTKRPIVALLTGSGALHVLDGFHRIEVAHEIKASHLIAAIGLGEKFDYYADDEDDDDPD